MTRTRWSRTRQITQIISTVLFFVLAFLTFRGSDFLIPLDVYLRVNPLVALAAMLATRTFIATMALAFIALALGFVVGRAWCGWLCPLGAILDWVSPRTPHKSESRAHWRGIKFGALFLILFAALMGNLTFLILDPITILNRTFSGAVLPALNALILGIEMLLTPLAPLGPIVDVIEQNLRGTVLPAQQTTYALGILLALVFGGVVALNWVASRFWCRYLCPLGAVYALQAQISWLRPRAVKDCSHCAACMKACPTGAITVTKQGFTVNSGECVACMDCVSACPESVIGFRPRTINRQSQPSNRQPSSVSSRALSRRQFIASATTAIASVALFRAAPSAKRDDAFLVRPPGTRENDFLEKCIRCAECVKVCPTGALQPSLFEAGVEGFWTPLLVPRGGYCDYSCNACGQICPTGAIPPLALEQKRETIIGVAYIDEHRCLPWASYTRCVVCEEMCPVPEKAIRLDEVNLVTPDGRKVYVQRPRVIHDLCIGCGICEYQCPLAGPAAIRVYVPTHFPSRT